MAIVNIKGLDHSVIYRALYGYVPENVYINLGKGVFVSNFYDEKHYEGAGQAAVDSVIIASALECFSHNDKGLLFTEADAKEVARLMHDDRSLSFDEAVEQVMKQKENNISLAESIAVCDIAEHPRNTRPIPEWIEEIEKADQNQNGFELDF